MPCHGRIRALAWNESYHDRATENVGRTRLNAGNRRGPIAGAGERIGLVGLTSMKIGRFFPRDPTYPASRPQVGADLTLHADVEVLHDGRRELGAPADEDQAGRETGRAGHALQRIPKRGPDTPTGS